MRRTLRAFVVSQGEELLTGQTVDTNSNFLCGALTDLGFRVVGGATAPDRDDAIAQTLRNAAERADVVICTGGLGPTADDLTANAAAAAFGREVELNREALAQVEARYASAGRQMAPANRRQALLPAGCEVLPNVRGTAPGFALRTEAGARLYFLPGVPPEMKAMWRDVVLPRLREELTLSPPRRHLFRVLGRGESQLQDLLGDVPDAFGGVELGFRTRMPENQVKLVAEPSIDEVAWCGAIAEVRERLGRDLFSEDEGVGLAGRVGELLVERGHRLALAESCTGGWIAHLCVSEPGSSRWLERGFVTYSNASKVAELGVSQATLDELGAVAEPVATEMAEGCRRVAGADWGVGVTGIAGPTGGTPDKPVGTVCVAVAGPAGTRVKTLRLPARDRTTVRRFSAHIALDMLRRQLLRT